MCVPKRTVTAGSSSSSTSSLYHVAEMGSSSVAEMTNAIDYTTKAGKLKARILKNYKDLNIDRVDTSTPLSAGGEAGNSGQTPPNEDGA